MTVGIKKQIIKTYVTVAVISLAVLGALLVWALRDFYLADMRLALANEARLLAGFIGQEVAREEFSKLDEEAKRFGGELNSRITVVLADGRVVADTQFDPASLDNHKNRPEIKTALSGGVGQGVRFSASSIIENLYVAVPVFSGGEIVGAVRFALPLSEIKLSLLQLMGFMLIALLLTGLVGLALFLKMAKELTGPLQNISSGARKIAAGDWTTKVYSRPGNELGELGQSLNAMTDKLQEQFAEVSQEKSRLENIVNTMPSGVMVLDKAGRVQLINRAAEKMLGINAATALGKLNLEVIRHFGLNQQIEKSLTETTIIDYEFQYRLAENKDIQCAIAPVYRDKTVNGATLVFHDITELRKVERMRTDFVANASHELRTPLTVIKGYAETLLSGAMEDPAARDKFVAVISQEAERMQRLVDELLVLSRLESEKKPEQQEADLLPLVREITEEMRQLFVEKEIDFQVQLPDQLPQVLAGSDQVRQVLANLLDNARKYTPSGGRVELSAAAGEGEVRVSVKDSGIGIPPQDLDRVFERFYRVDKSRQRQMGGFGLGLAIVKHLVDNFGGRLGAESKSGEGSLFWFTIPLKKATKQS